MAERRLNPWLTNELAYRRRREQEQRGQLSNRRSQNAKPPAAPKPVTPAQLAAASAALDKVGASVGLNFNSPRAATSTSGSSSNRPRQPTAASSSSRPAATTSGGGRGGAATPPASRPASRPSGGGSSRTSTPTTSSGGGGGKASPASETYRDGGKGLYQGTKEYRDKVGGSGNPLLNRFRQDMGRDTATGNKSDIRTTRAGTDIGGAGSGGNYSTPADKSKYVAPNGQLYQGPGYGSGQVPYKKPADDKPKVETKPQRRMSAGDQRYMNEWEKRRRGQSNVIG